MCLFAKRRTPILFTDQRSRIPVECQGNRHSGTGLQVNPVALPFHEPSF